MAGRAKVLVASGFVVAEGHDPGLQTRPSILPEQINHLSNLLGHPPTSSQLCHTACVCVSLSLSSSPSLALCLILSFSLTILPSLYHPLTVSLTHYCCLLHLSHSSSLCLSLSYHLLPFPFTMSLPLTPLLFLSPPLSSIFPITVCILNTLVAEEKSLRFH